MNSVSICTFFGLVFLLILPGFCVAEEVPGLVAYVQGGNASIKEDPDGSLVLTVHDIIPYFYLKSEKNSYLIPLDGLSGFSYPLNAAVLFSGSDADSGAFVIISNLSLSDENTLLTAHVSPNEFYEGEALKTRIDNQGSLNLTRVQNYPESSIYLEIPLIPSINTQSMNDDWGLCIVNCYLNGGAAPCNVLCQKYKPN